MKSYDEILESMKSDFFERTGCNADEASDTGIKLRVLAGELYNLQSYAEWIKKQAFPQTAQGEYLDYFAQSRGLERKSAQKAVGNVRFSIDEPTNIDVEILAGTIVSTGGEKPVSFVTLDYGIIHAGETYVDVYAEAVVGGFGGNVGKNMISVIVTVTSENISVTNPTAFSLGSDDEDDETLRERVINSMRFIINGTNREYYSSLAKSIKGVECVNVVPHKFGRGTVGIYISGKRNVLTQSVVNQVKSLISEQREINVNVYVYSANIVDTIIEAEILPQDGYDIDEIKTRVFDTISSKMENFNVGQSISMAEINDVFYHTEGIKSYSIVERGTSGINANFNEKLVLRQINLRSVE